MEYDITQEDYNNLTVVTVNSYSIKICQRDYINMVYISSGNNYNLQFSISFSIKVVSNNDTYFQMAKFMTQYLGALKKLPISFHP